MVITVSLTKTFAVLVPHTLFQIGGHFPKYAHALWRGVLVNIDIILLECFLLYVEKYFYFFFNFSVMNFIASLVYQNV